MTDQFGDRMKRYEAIEANREFTPLLPIMVRLDGKCFSKWTKGLTKPYDERMIQLMTDVTTELVRESNAIIGYTQSDEISLVLYSDDIIRPIYFNGRITKIVSVLSSVATYWFNRLVQEMDFPEHQRQSPGLFDCRAWTVPSRTEAVNSILWRETDAVRNSINSAARTVFSHKELTGVKKAEIMDRLMEHGINWNDYPAAFKRGTYIQKRLGEYVTLDMPPMNRVLNRVGVFFEQQDAITD